MFLPLVTSGWVLVIISVKLILFHFLRLNVCCTSYLMWTGLLLPNTLSFFSMGHATQIIFPFLYKCPCFLASLAFTGILFPPLHKIGHIQGTLGSGLTLVLISFTVSTSQASLLIPLLSLLLTPNFVSFSTLPPTHGTASQLTYVKILHYPPSKTS